MKKINVNVYKFNELPKDVQEKLIEKIEMSIRILIGTLLFTIIFLKTSNKTME